MTVVATNVNKSSVIAANWSTTKSLIATSTPEGTNDTRNIPITVVPCAVEAVSTITKLQAAVGDTAT
jgi:hypothetical protein